jgi:hypothetical protein
LKKGGQGIVLVVQFPLQRILSDMGRKRCIGTEQAQEVHGHARRAFGVTILKGIKAGRSETQRGFLPKPDGIFIGETRRSRRAAVPDGVPLAA